MKTYTRRINPATFLKITTPGSHDLWAGMERHACTHWAGRPCTCYIAITKSAIKAATEMED